MKRNINNLEYLMPQGLLRWYDFQENDKILVVYNQNGSILDMLNEKKINAIAVSNEDSTDISFLKKNKNSFDYIISIETFELSKAPVKTLKYWASLLKKDGKLLLGCNNRLAIKNFCGDKDPYSGKVLDGVDNYRNIEQPMLDSMNGRCYSKAEYINFFKEAGIPFINTFSVLPNLQCPQLIYSDTYTPKEVLSNRYFPKYNNPDTIFLEEEYLYTDLINNNLFHPLANAFLFECSLSEINNKINMVTVSMDREKKNALATIIRKDNIVEKIALFDEGRNKFEQIEENNKRLNDLGIKTINGKILNNRYIMPFVDGITVNEYLQQLIDKDVNKFISEMDRFHDIVLRSSRIIKTDSVLGPIMEYGYQDLVPLNCFYFDGDFVFFDQEFTEENYPVNVIILRQIAMVYDNNKHRESILPREFFINRYGLNKGLEPLYKYADKFTTGLRCQSNLEEYNKKHCRNINTLLKNRERMNYSEEEYEYLLYNPLVDAGNKKLFIFGSGKYAEKFIAMYKKDYDIYGLLDNNSEKWNTKLEGYLISSPDILYQYSPDEYKVIICIKDYNPILMQLKKMGILNISVYQSQKVYPGRQACAVPNMYKDSGKPKKYHIGYLAGVFDLYHLGHLNMFRRAKEQCDYLIVGVVTDEGVRVFKGKEPFVPFDERIEMVRSCRFVDEAVEIPFIYRTTKEAFEKYHFDVQFSGSDYENDPGWLETKRWLEEHGAKMVFFPYTQQTSSTKIKSLIDKKLL